MSDKTKAAINGGTPKMIEKTVKAMSRRLQFSMAVSALAAIAAAFFAGMAVQRRIDAPISIERRPLDTINTRKSDKYVKVMVLRDGTLWYKADDP